jgi:SAM-dependent methyltransferase
MRDSAAHVAREIARDNPWYTADQIENQRLGVYRHNMQLRYQYVHKHLAKLRLPGRNVVDLGCGDGQWSMELIRRYDLQLTGIDYNLLRMQRYRSNVPGADAQCGSCIEIPVAPHAADLVMFHQVLEHIPQPERALREVHRILKPGGWLLLSVPNEGTWLKQHVQYRWFEPKALASSDHVNFFTAASLHELLEACSFSVIRLDAVGFYFPHNGVSRRILTRRVGFALGVVTAHALPVLHDCLFAWCQLQVSA